MSFGPSTEYLADHIATLFRVAYPTTDAGFGLLHKRVLLAT